MPAQRRLKACLVGGRITDRLRDEIEGYLMACKGQECTLVIGPKPRTTQQNRYYRWRLSQIAKAANEEWTSEEFTRFRMLVLAARNALRESGISATVSDVCNRMLDPDHFHEVFKAFFSPDPETTTGLDTTEFFEFAENVRLSRLVERLGIDWEDNARLM